jgi:predicted ArsR family transcriptional regulator
MTAWDVLAVLADPVRRRLYEYVRSQAHPVTREEAAHAAGVSRNLAAFHLDKLVGVGLLTARHGAPTGAPRRAGRAPKVYQPSDMQVSLTIPERRYELLGDILVQAVADEPHNAAEAAQRISHQRGAGVGRAAGTASMVGVLAGLGFEPRASAGGITLANCPFQRLASKAPDFVCELNHRFLAGVLHGLGNTVYRAVLARQPGACCVELRS